MSLKLCKWDDHLLFCVADKAIGGEMCAILSLDDPTENQPFAVISYPSTPDRFAELVELEGITPSKYLARAHWVSAASWSIFRTSEWEAELRAAYALTLAKLAPRTHKILALPKAEQRRIVADRKALEAAKAQKPTSSPS